MRSLERHATLLVFSVLIGGSGAFVACGGDDSTEFHGSGGFAGAAGSAGAGGTSASGGTGGSEAGDDVVSNGDANVDAMDDAETD
jgi:hypothetical protein